MRYAVILAGGSGTRLWPLSRRDRPKQLVPLVGGRSLLELAFERLAGLTPPGNRLVCGAEAHREPVTHLLGLADDQYLGEPVGRDTLAALTLSAAVVARKDPQAVLGVFTADHLIEPVADFRALAANGFALVEQAQAETLLTFGVTPTHAATGFGYLELGEKAAGGARVVRRFQEKPDRPTAERYLAAGPGRYLWNSGMFMWRARTFLACVQRYEPELHAGIEKAVAATDRVGLAAGLRAVYPSLRRISVDYGVMEPAAADPALRVLALPLAVQWRDIGSWSSYAATCAADEAGNAVASGKGVLLECSGTLLVSADPDHLITAVGCEDLVIVHTDTATLVCPKNRVQEIKELRARVAQEHGEEYV